MRGPRSSLTASGVPTTATARAAAQGRSQTPLQRAARLRTTRTRSLERGARSAPVVGDVRPHQRAAPPSGNSTKPRPTARATVPGKPAVNDRVGMRRALEAGRFRLRTFSVQRRSPRPTAPVGDVRFPPGRPVGRRAQSCPPRHPARSSASLSGERARLRSAHERGLRRTDKKFNENPLACERKRLRFPPHGGAASPSLARPEREAESDANANKTGGSSTSAAPEGLRGGRARQAEAPTAHAGPRDDPGVSGPGRATARRQRGGAGGAHPRMARPRRAHRAQRAERPRCGCRPGSAPPHPRGPKEQGVREPAARAAGGGTAVSLVAADGGRRSPGRTSTARRACAHPRDQEALAPPTRPAGCRPGETLGLR